MVHGLETMKAMNQERSTPRGGRTTESLRTLLSRISYRDWEFELLELRPRGWLLRVSFWIEDDYHHGRKWYISEHATDSEVVQTALLAVLTAEEHEVRERFLVDGESIFGPHHDINALRNIKQDLRPKIGTVLTEEGKLSELRLQWAKKRFSEHFEEFLAAFRESL